MSPCAVALLLAAIDILRFAYSWQKKVFLNREKFPKAKPFWVKVCWLSGRFGSDERSVASAAAPDYIAATRHTAAESISPRCTVLRICFLGGDIVFEALSRCPHAWLPCARDIRECVFGR